MRGGPSLAPGRPPGSGSTPGGEPCPLAEAGVDVLTIANQQVFEDGIVERTIDIIAAHVSSGRISQRRIDESWNRIRVFKENLAH